MKVYRYLIIGGLLLVIAGLVMVSPTLAQEDPNPVGDPPTFLRGYYDAWVTSPHADFEAEAFIHWNEEEEKVVPETCAQCHSTPGYLDYLGEDGSEAGVVNAPAPLGTVVNCDACHNSTASNLTSVTFPSGVEVTNLSDATRCMVCHQGRASGNSVTVALESAGLTEDLNTVSPDLRFINIHYYAAAASLYGAEVVSGYQYEGKTYQPRNEHVEGYDTCDDCHNPHTLELKVEECADCHEDVEDVEDLREIRMNGSLIDYDGDGEIEEGIAEEIETLQEMLYEAMQTYASEVAGTPLLYDEHAYPYFFADPNANGTVDEGEGGYNTFTGRLLQAAYNYQVSLKDPGAYAHNPKYHIELLYDSIEALNTEISQVVDLSEAWRNDPGHFDATAEAFRHWDEDGEVPGTCAKCHTAGGLPVFMANGVNIAAQPSSSLSCSTCHNDIGEFTLFTLNEVRFPSGATVSFGEEEESNLCLNCHQGRESTVSVDRAIQTAGVGDDDVSDSLSFRNVHYFAAGATLFGSEAMGAYQFADKEYTGRNEHQRPADECVDCHNEHSLVVDVELCQDCHEEVEEPEDIHIIRAGDEQDIEPIDFDGDGDVTEPIAAEIETFQTDLYANIQTYAADVVGTPIVYAPLNHPYWYIDANANGTLEPEELNSDGRYVTWTPTLLRAAYNYQYSQKDPGAFAHNPLYILQVLYDSLEAVGGEDAVASYTRAPLEMED